MFVLPLQSLQAAVMSLCEPVAQHHHGSATDQVHAHEHAHAHAQPGEDSADHAHGPRASASDGQSASPAAAAKSKDPAGVSDHVDACCHLVVSLPAQHAPPARLAVAQVQHAARDLPFLSHMNDGLFRPPRHLLA